MEITKIIIYVVAAIVAAIGCIGGAIAFMKWRQRVPRPKTPARVPPPEKKPPLKKAPPKLSPSQIQSMVYGYIVSHGGELDIDECAEELEIPKSDVEAAIKALKAAGKLKKG